jgi:hypothetical protein
VESPRKSFRCCDGQSMLLKSFQAICNSTTRLANWSISHLWSPGMEMSECILRNGATGARRMRFLDCSKFVLHRLYPSSKIRPYILKLYNVQFVMFLGNDARTVINSFISFCKTPSCACSESIAILARLAAFINDPRPFGRSPECS